MIPTRYRDQGSSVHACNCIGPQNGQPLCPCAMRSVQIVDGRYVQVKDLGPAPGTSKSFPQEYSEFNRLVGEDKGSVR